MKVRYLYYLVGAVNSPKNIFTLEITPTFLQSLLGTNNLKSSTTLKQKSVLKPSSN